MAFGASVSGMGTGSEEKTQMGKVPNRMTTAKLKSRNQRRVLPAQRGRRHGDVKSVAAEGCDYRFSGPW